jgi:hypothetical protein
MDIGPSNYSQLLVLHLMCCILWKGLVLRIRIGFNADPETDLNPAFLSLRSQILIRIQIQGFDDQKLEKIYNRKNYIF